MIGRSGLQKWSLLCGDCNFGDGLEHDIVGYWPDLTFSQDLGNSRLPLTFLSGQWELSLY